MTSNVTLMKEPDAAAMQAMLEHLFGGDLDGCHNGLIELAWTDDKGKPNKAKYYGTDQLEDLVDDAVTMSRVQSTNVYIGAAIRRPDTFPGARSEDDDFYALTCLYVDLDDPGIAEQAKSIYDELGCPPTGVVVTGREPHKRAQLFWRLREPIRDPERSRTLNRAIANRLGGDPSVTNPGRILRLAGSIAWPHKKDRVFEVTEWHDFGDKPERPSAFFAEQIERAFGVAKQDNTASSSDAPRHAISGRIDLTKTLEATRQQGHWHHNMVAAVGSMISRGWSDEQIRMTCAPYCEKGANDPDLDPIINTGRRKWDKPDPDDGEFEDVKTDGEIELVRWSQLVDIDLNWLVDSLLPEQAFAVIFGRPGTYKSFFALHLAASIASGKPFFGGKTTPGPVVYVAGEGAAGLKQRRDAAIKQHGFADDLPVYFVRSQLDLRNPKADTARLIEAIKASEEKPSLVIIDTLQRAFAGGNENASEDMGAFINNIGIIQARLGCAVLVVHHSGKDPDKKGRGWSGLLGAVDTEFELTRLDAGGDDERAGMFKVTKQKDGEDGQEFGFRAVAVPLGALGAKTSLAIEECDLEDVDTRERKSGKQTKRDIGLEALVNALAKAGRPPEFVGAPSVTGVKIDEWKHEFYSLDGAESDRDDRARLAFGRAKKALNESSVIAMSKGWVWRT